MGKYRANGKQVYFQQDDVPAIHIADAKDNEAAHFLATMANNRTPEVNVNIVKVKTITIDKLIGDNFNYAAECEKVNSNIWQPEQVDWAPFEDLLARFSHIGEKLNLYKKLFFRGKTPPEVGLEYPVNRSMSAAEFFDDKDADLVHGLMGHITEAAEMADILLKMLHGENANPANVAEECGDTGWYRELLLKWLDVSNDTINRANIDKLHGRFDGAAFNAERDWNPNRNLEAESDKLQKSLKLDK